MFDGPGAPFSGSAVGVCTGLVEARPADQCIPIIGGCSWHVYVGDVAVRCTPVSFTQLRVAHGGWYNCLPHSYVGLLLVPSSTTQCLFPVALVSPVASQCTANRSDYLVLQGTPRDSRRFDHHDNIALSFARSQQGIKRLAVGLCCLWRICLSHEHKNTALGGLLLSTSRSA
ncbi:unnamed protein product [Didymodactylos carnosus]|uniref:Uncharacterized protein n=1 Tax=Didymodactylos carnosus TaxID=1234261 RepID=A0A814RRD8_9BILA|nr:unnamed protein product [Didymodactylos carnosus]CAF3900947.1 unnamed protein product [Didymodactylos carnosus]